MLQEVLQKNSKARGAARARRLARGRLPHQQAAGLQAHPAEPVDALLVEQGEGPDRAADADARTRRGTTAIRVPAAACAASAGGLESEREAGLSPLQAGRAWRPHEEAEEGWEPSSRGAAPAPSSSGGSSEDYGFSNNTRSSMGPPALSAGAALPIAAGDWDVTRFRRCCIALSSRREPISAGASSARS